MEERGIGSVARQKVCCICFVRHQTHNSVQTFFRTFVDESKDDLFEGSSDAIMAKLNDAAKAAAEALRVGTLELADKVCIRIYGVSNIH